MVLLQGIMAQPAFDPCAVGPEPSKGIKKRHYPAAYLEKIRPMPFDIKALVDITGDVLVSITSWAVWFWATFIHTFILWENDTIGISAFFNSTWETIFLRQYLVLSSIGCAHALATMVGYHLRDIFFTSPLWPSTHNTIPPLPLVDAMMGEYHSHRTHLTTFIDALKPALPLRLLLIVVQVVMFALFLPVCLIYPTQHHAVARLFSVACVNLLSDAIATWDKKHMATLTKCRVPTAARQFYGLDENATFRDVLLCARADDVFHEQLHEVCVFTDEDKRFDRLCSLTGSGQAKVAPHQPQGVVQAGVQAVTSTH